MRVVSNAQQLQEIEAYFHQQMPLTQAMGVRVKSYNGHQLTLTAPLSLNHNHLGTAFGGSLSAMATLAGYGLIWLELPDRAAHVVIRESSMSFIRPVRGDIQAVCRRPPAEALEVFKTTLAHKGKARIQLEVAIIDDGMNAVEFQGTFVAIR